MDQVPSDLSLSQAIVVLICNLRTLTMAISKFFYCKNIQIACKLTWIGMLYEIMYYSIVYTIYYNSLSLSLSLSPSNLGWANQREGATRRVNQSERAVENALGFKMTSTMLWFIAQNTYFLLFLGRLPLRSLIRYKKRRNRQTHKNTHKIWICCEEVEGGGSSIYILCIWSNLFFTILTLVGN